MDKKYLPDKRYKKPFQAFIYSLLNAIKTKSFFDGIEFYRFVIYYHSIDRILEIPTNNKIYDRSLCAPAYRRFVFNYLNILFYRKYVTWDSKYILGNNYE